MNKVLFPSSNPNLDFATAGGSLGWVPVQNNITLGTMADNIIPTNARIADHAIPSPVAHVKDFYTKLNNGDKDAINEWRGMLAVIALQELKSLNITIKQIPIYDDPTTGTPSMLGRIICDALTENEKITGYSFMTQNVLVENVQKTQFIIDSFGDKVPTYKTLSVFCKDGTPFAMFMPGMVICPFKDYSKNLFAGLEWYDAQANKWLDVLEVINPHRNSLSVTAQKLYWWVSSLLNGHNDNNLLAFRTDILGVNAVPTVNQANNPIEKDYGSVNIWSELKTICPPPQGAPRNAYSDKLFVIIPPDRHFQAKDLNGKDYGIEKNGFSPKVKQVNNRYYYVVPPIHHDVVNCLRSGYADFVYWDIVPSADSKSFTFEFKLNFSASGEIMTYKKVYNDIDVAYTDSMPYISLWPFVNFAGDDWKEHYVSIWNETTEVSRRGLGHYSCFTENINCKKVTGYNIDGTTTPKFQISLVALRDNSKVDVCDCSSAYRNKCFTMLQSDSQPFALEFSYSEAGKTYFIGSWIIDRKDAVAINPANIGRSFYIAMDFGTTSTNVYMRENVPTGPSVPESISSAGKFLHDIYNPYIDADNYDKQKISDFIQNYYLFSSKVGPMGKIFTYGQNFEAKKNSMPFGDIESNVSGRAVVVDEEFIINNDNGNSRIYNSLKLYKANQPQELSRAAHNFILNVLTFAVLEARVKGATNITIRVSYPAENFGSVVINYLNNVQNALRQKSPAKITIEGTTEACAAGEYFAHYATGIYAPVPTEGYGVIDIGGGTTDFSFWRQEPGKDKLEMKAEHSFGYAGRYLVVKTFIQAIKNDNDFKNMWQFAGGSAEEKAIRKYMDTAVNLPLSENYINTSTEYTEKSAALDFILEKVAVNSGMLEGDTYEPLFSTMRIKYFSLFYLIAKYIKAKASKNVINLSDNNTRICLAGCGSKGIKLCSVGHIGNMFMTNLENMMKLVIGLPANYSFGITAPDKDKKEEVVFGLTITQNAKALDSIISNNGGAVNPGGLPWGAAAAVGTNVAEQAEPAKEEFVNVDYDVNTLMSAYQELIAMLSYYEQNKGDGSHLLDKIDLSKNESAVVYFRNIFAQIKQRMYGANYDADTYLEHFSLLMLDTMIDNFI